VEGEEEKKKKRHNNSEGEALYIKEEDFIKGLLERSSQEKKSLR